MTYLFSTYTKDTCGRIRKRSYRTDGDTVHIRMKGGHEAVIDWADFDRASGVTWSLGDQGYARGKADGRYVKLHRYIFDPGPGIDVDHRDLDRLNCRRSNLRSATRAQNCRNSRGRARRESRYKGVTGIRSGWIAQIGANGKHYHLGTYDTSEQAALAYDVAALNYHGEFARLNFPTIGERDPATA